MHLLADPGSPTVRLLGSVALVGPGVERAPVGRGQAALLAALALQDGRVVMPGRLVLDLWGDSAPTDPAAALQSQISRLRKFLGPGLLLRESGGYRLVSPPLTADVTLFDRLVRAGLAAIGARDHDDALRQLTAAIALWVDEPLTDLRDYPFAAAAAERLTEQRLQATAAAIELEIALGGHANVLAQLTELTTQHPLREDLWALRLLALYRSGRAADALSAHRRAREALDREVGLDPGPQLQRLEQAILRHDPQLHVGFPAAATRAPAPART